MNIKSWFYEMSRDPDCVHGELKAPTPSMFDPDETLVCEIVLNGNLERVDLAPCGNDGVMVLRVATGRDRMYRISIEEIK